MKFTIAANGEALYTGRGKRKIEYFQGFIGTELGPMQQIDILKLYKSKTALLIDDFPDMRGSIRRMLVASGVDRVDTAPTGEEAIRMCESGRYNLVISDYNLGDGKNGQQVLEELRYRRLLNRTDLYMMITAETNRIMVFGCLEYQPDDYLAKPFTQAVLQRRLNRLVIEKEALKPIHRAMDEENWEQAILACEAQKEIEDRYTTKRLRLLTESLYHSGKLERAAEIYREVLERRELEWAEIGLGKTLIKEGALQEAASIFRKLVNNDCLCLEVYDCLADIENQVGNFQESQQLLEHASDISPNAILRQQTLAKISEENGDIEAAIKARKKSLKLAIHSCYESPDVYLELARVMGKKIASEDQPDPKALKEATEVLRRAEKRYEERDVSLRCQLNQVQLLHFGGKEEESEELLTTLKEEIGPIDETNPQVLLALAETHHAVGDKESCNKILKFLAVHYGDDEAIGDAIDRISDEPLSKKGKQYAVVLNKQAKDLFGQNEFHKATEVFEQALRIYPNNIALLLNAVLAAIREMETNGVNLAGIKQCESLFARVDELDPGHPQYERHQKLVAHFNSLTSELVDEL